jgi:hypothetical protein
MATKAAKQVASTDVTVPGADTMCDLSALNAHIAAELAAGLSDAAAVRERYGISASQWDVLKKSTVFRNMLAEAIRTLRGDLNAGNRIKIKADIILEDALPAYDSMIHDREVPAQARIDAGKLVAAINGRLNKQGDGPQSVGSGFTLNINIGEREKMVIDGKNFAVIDEQ